MTDLPVRDDGWLAYDDDRERESSVCRCASCGRTYRVLADERDMHDCPRCGYGPRDDEGDDE